MANEDDVVRIVVRPEDGLCEGCGEQIGDEIFETDDMVTVCKKCWELCLKEAEDGEPNT